MNIALTQSPFPSYIQDCVKLSSTDKDVLTDWRCFYKQGKRVNRYPMKSISLGLAMITESLALLAPLSVLRVAW